MMPAAVQAAVRIVSLYRADRNTRMGL